MINTIFCCCKKNIAVKTPNMNVLTYLPIGGCCHFVQIRQLNRVNDAQYFTTIDRKQKKHSNIIPLKLTSSSFSGTYSKLRPDEAGYKIDTRNFLFGSITNTARHVKATPASLISSRSSIFNLTANSRAASSMIGYGNGCCVSSVA